MSGLLHRLAARAMGIAAPLRTTASLAYGTPEEPAPKPALDEPARPEPPAIATRESPAEAFVPPLARVAADSSAPVPAFEDGRPLEPQPRPESRARMSAARRPHDPPPPLHVTPTLAPPAAPPQIAAPAAPPRLDPPLVPLDPPTRGPRPESSPAAIPPPQPMLPLRTRDARLPPALAAARRAPSPSKEETTEVHVTIGRIEVTAVHEAPGSKKAPARARKARSLDEYLAARQGDRS